MAFLSPKMSLSYYVSTIFTIEHTNCRVLILQPRTKPVNRASHLDKEEMYDEIQRLKELIAAFTKEKGLRQTRITKLEKELGKKVRDFRIL